MSTNGSGWSPDQQTIDQELQPVINAFEASLDPRTSNHTRREALLFIEQLTAKPEALEYGILLARDLARPQSIRYFGFQMLEYALRYRFDTIEPSQIDRLVVCVRTLAMDCLDTEPAFIRNKIAQLWVECADRTWPDQWKDMDSHLGELWTTSHADRRYASMIIVLDILEALSSGVAGGENSTLIRLEELGGALYDVMVPTSALLRSSRLENTPRWGDEGWLSRLAIVLRWCAEQLNHAQLGRDFDAAQTCALRALSTISSLSSWMDLASICAAGIAPACGLLLSCKQPDLLCSAIDTLRSITQRSHDQQSRTQLLELFFNGHCFVSFANHFAGGPAESLPSAKHELQKKTSELLAAIFEAAIEQPEIAMKGDAYQYFFDLLLQIIQSDNLLVSIPVLHAWSKFLAKPTSPLQYGVNSTLGVLMQTCTIRLIDFERLNNAASHPIACSVFEEFETMPERHAFLSNYRRYCNDVIRLVARRRPLEAVQYVIEQTQSLLSTGKYRKNSGFDASTYDRHSLAVRQAEAQFNTAHSVLLALLMWREQPNSASDQAATVENWEEVQVLTKTFCHNLCNVVLDDPEVECMAIGLLSALVRHVQTLSDCVLDVTRYVLQVRIDEAQGNETFVNYMKDFESVRVTELQKIALAHPNALFTAYSELTHQITRLSAEFRDNKRVAHGCQAFLLIITLRADAVPHAERLAQLQELLRPMAEMWSRMADTNAISTLEAFHECLGLSRLSDFFVEHGFDRIEDWAETQLSPQGQARLDHIKAHLDMLPLRYTRALLGATTEKLDIGSDTYGVACELWTSLMPVILPPLLQMIRHAQAFSNMSNWSSLTPEIQAVLRRTLQDRFWQAGISSESRDEFYARVSGSKISYEGFASAVRGSMRNVREQGYQILFLLSKFELQFYGLNDLPQPLADALLDDLDSLSANHLSPLLALMTGLSTGCPPQHRIRFLPPLLRKLFIKLDSKITSDWDAATRATDNDGDDDDLSEEMRIESVLRQVTYAAVSFIAVLLGNNYKAQPKLAGLRPQLSEIVLSDTSILEPLIMFCTHALRMRDTRCCTHICKVLIDILPHFTGDNATSAAVREFICSEVFKACITSLNEQYFADMQRDLASLLTQIILLYSPKTSTPRTILLSLPNMQEQRVDSTLSSLRKQRSSRQQRALILNLLESVRGVSIHDMGKLTRPTTNEKLKNSVQAQYMEVEQKPSIIDGTENGLDDIAGLFGNT